MINEIKTRFMLWMSVLFDIMDNVAYITTFTLLKTRIGIQFRLWLVDGMLKSTAAKIERERDD